MCGEGCNERRRSGREECNERRRCVGRGVMRGGGGVGGRDVMRGGGCGREGCNERRVRRVWEATYWMVAMLHYSPSQH